MFGENRCDCTRRYGWNTAADLDSVRTRITSTLLRCKAATSCFFSKHFGVAAEASVHCVQEELSLGARVHPVPIAGDAEVVKEFGL